MNYLVCYNKARLEIESAFNGLPHVHTTLIKSLITRADPETGIVENLSYREIAEFLAIYHAPGRRGAGIPKKDTIRSYFRTIAENHPEDFKLVSQGQKFKCQFPKMPATYAHFFAPEKVDTGSSNQGDTGQVQKESDTDASCQGASNPFNTSELPTEARPEAPVKNINNNKITNNNNYSQYRERLKAISVDFVPSPETIAKAIALGYSDAGNLEDIQAFIRYNQDIGSRFADYNPIYLRWLSRTAIKADFRPTTEVIESALAKGYATAADAAEIEAFIAYNQSIGSRHQDYNVVYLSWLAKGQLQKQQQKQQLITSQGYSGSRGHHATTKYRSYDEAVAAVAAAFPNPRSPSERLAAERSAWGAVNS